MDIVGFERRVISFIIDAVIALGFGTIIYFLLSQRVNMDFLTLPLWLMIFEIVIYAIFNTFFLWTFNGISIGQFIVRSRVLRFDGKRMTFRDSAIRAVLLSIPMMVVLNAIYMIVQHTEISIFDQLTNSKIVSINNKGVN